MREFLSGLFEVSLTMGAVTALLLVLSPVWKRRFRPQWRCWAWLLVALRLAVPFNVSLPRAPVVLEAPAPAAVSAAWVEEGGFQGVELTARTLPPGEAAPEAVGRGLSLTTAELAFAVWAAVAAGVLAGRLLRYAAFRRRTARWCTPAGAYEGVPVYACALLSSPALTGLLRPRILLPEGVEEERRAFALAHEAMHARRRDLWRKALLLWVCALHWFNPLVWLLRRAAERDMEIACDAAVLAGRDGEWRRRYGAALLSFVPVGRPAPLTSQFAGGARGLKERFRALMDASAKRPGRAALLLVLCAALLGGPLVACQSRAPEESLPDGTYWMVPAKLEWQEPLERLAVHMAEVDGKTMELLDVGRETLVFPLAEEVILGNYAEQGIKEFLETSVSLSYAKQVLEVEMEDGKIAAMTSRAVFPPDGLTEYPEYPVKEPDLADGTYWATLSLSDWWTAGEEGIELLLSLVEVDTDTMTLLRVAPEKTSLPVADDVTLGNHGDSGLDGFLQWAALSSYWPMVLEAEVVGGEITALTWHDASLPLDPDPLSQWEQKADHPASHYTGLPDGTYWAIPMSATDWEEAGKRGRELSLRSVTMDPDTMTVTTTDGFSGISLPVAEDVVLGGGETELSDFLNRPDWGTGAVLELEVTGGKITALTAWEARFSVEELAPDGDYIIGNLYDFRAENASGFPICFKARMYEVEEDTWRVTNLIGTSTFRVDEADLCREDGTPYEGGVLSFLNEFCADSDELYWRRHPEPYPFVNRLTLQATVRGGYITSLTRLPEPEW